MSTTTYIEQFMRRRYRLPQWALFFEVPNAIGISYRRADAIAVSLDVHTRGRVLGFEFKVSRNDWLRELKQPEKAACFAEKCNEFYIVAPQDVVYRDEVPEKWGWWCPVTSKRLKKPAKNPDDNLRTELISTLDLDLMCILLRRAALNCEKYEAIRRIVNSSVNHTRDFDTKEEGGTP